MNKLFIAAALAALVSSPALARTAHKAAHVHKHAVSQNHAWAQPSVHAAQARYFAVDPAADPRFDRQLGNDYEQRP